MMGHSLSELEMATRHVVEGNARIRLMHDLIAARRLRGEDTALSMQLLETMLVSLDIMIEHKNQIGTERKLIGPG